MNYSISFTEKMFEEITRHLFPEPFTEQAVFLLCSNADLGNEKKLLVKDVIYVGTEDIEQSTAVSMNIKSQAYLRAIKRADNEKLNFVFMHSHPDGFDSFSIQDDMEEKKLFKTAYNRIHHDAIHASLVMTKDALPKGRVWFDDMTNVPLSKVSVVGKSFRYRLDPDNAKEDTSIFDRQVRAFGEASQKLLGQLRIGVVGVGGTGSSVLEQLVRLGVRDIVIADGDIFDRTNCNRVYGSSTCDHGKAKVDIAERSALSKGLGVKITKLARSITFKKALEQFKSCDVIFACTDDEWGRSLLTRLSIYYHIPVIDMGVKIDSSNSIIKSIEGRVTTLYPGTGCLFCRRRISPRNVQFEALSVLDPEAAQRLVDDGYAPELGGVAPSVVPFTTAIAAEAINEFIHRLTLYMGAERTATEVIHFFDQNRTRTNSKTPEEGCFCFEGAHWGRGDVVPFLDVTWREEID